MSIAGCKAFSAALFACLVAASVPRLAHAAPRYVAVPLPIPAGTESYAAAINAKGDVVGELVTGFYWDWMPDAVFRYVDGVMEVVRPVSSGHTLSAGGISDDGRIVINAGTGDAVRAFVYDGQSMRDLGTLGGRDSVAFGVSGDGQVTGSSTTAEGIGHAFRYADGAMHDLGTLGGRSSVGIAISNAGDVTGWSNIGNDGSSHAFLHSGGGMRALDTLGGEDNWGWAINALGTVAGVSYTAERSTRAFLFDGRTMRGLGTLGGRDSWATGINVHGHVIGYARTAGDQSIDAFIYIDGVMHALRPLVVSGLEGIASIEVSAINDRGQMAANTCNGGSCRSFRLDPVPPAVEYRHAAFDHYFLTANADEIAKLDGGVFPGWARTGQTIEVHPDAAAGTHPVCRFFSAAFDPKSSHFYTADRDECEKVKADPAWQYEGTAFNIAKPFSYGGCPPDTQPVYRLYNDGKGGAPNHRFTTSLAARLVMIAAGWVSEGAGEHGVGMCAPA
jgi:probable HAF family extracellular repeat protein